MARGRVRGARRAIAFVMAYSITKFQLFSALYKVFDFSTYCALCCFYCCSRKAVAKQLGPHREVTPRCH